MTSSEDGQSPVQYRINVNGREQIVGRSMLAVFEIRALFGLDPNMELVVESDGADPDILLGPNDVITLNLGGIVKVFSRPHTMFG